MTPVECAAPHTHARTRPRLSSLLRVAPLTAHGRAAPRSSGRVICVAFMRMCKALQTRQCSALADSDPHQPYGEQGNSCCPSKADLTRAHGQYGYPPHRATEHTRLLAFLTSSRGDRRHAGPLSGSPHSRGGWCERVALHMGEPGPIVCLCAIRRTVSICLSAEGEITVCVAVGRPHACGRA